MKHQCPITGLIWHSQFGEGFTINPHPFLEVSSNDLLQCISSSKDSEDYSSIDGQIREYLFLVRILKDFPIRFNSNLKFPDAYTKLLSLKDKVINIWGRLDTVPKEYYPNYVITNDNQDLSCLNGYLASIEDVFTEFSRAHEERKRGQAILRKQEVIEHLMTRSSIRSRNRLSIILADWADLVLQFPTGATEFNGELVSLAELWKRAIRLSVCELHTTILSEGFALTDYEELLAECENGLELGTSYCHFLLESLRKTITVLRELTGPTIARAITSLEFSQLDSSNETTNSPIDPDAPVRSNYPSVKQYLDALLTYKKAKSTRANVSITVSTPSDTTGNV